MFRVSHFCIAATLIAASACESTAPTASASSGAPADAAADKQGTTSSQMLLAVNPPPFAVSRIDDDGTNLVQLTDYLANAFDAAWAPDGKRIIYAANIGPIGESSLFVMNADGTGVTRITYPPDGVFDGDAAAFDKGIVFVRGSSASGSSIYRANADGTGITQLTFGTSDTGPTASKGTLIAFVRDDDIYVLDVGTGGVTNLTNTPSTVERAPAFSPSGKQIAFSRMGEGVFVMKADGTAVTHVTTGTDDTPVWSPDGKRIAFGRANGTPNKTIYIANADGTGMTPLLPPSNTDYVLFAWAK